MTNAIAVKTDKNKLSVRFAEKFGVEPSALMNTLKATAFKQKEGKAISNEQLCALMIVADKYDLNPFVKEIYAYPDKGGGIVPIVGVDGWNHIMNNNPAFDGIEFTYSEETTTMPGAKECPDWIEAAIYLKNRLKPVVVREYLDECFQPSSFPWKSHTKRMLRHKAEIQCARVAFGFGGIYDEDEGKAIVNNEQAVVAPQMIEPDMEVFTAPPPPTEKPKRTRKTQPVETVEPETVEPEPVEPETIEAPPMVEPGDVSLF